MTELKNVLLSYIYSYLLVVQTVGYGDYSHHLCIKIIGKTFLFIFQNLNEIKPINEYNIEFMRVKVGQLENYEMIRRRSSKTKT